jgi:hypothetical protein
LPQIHPEALGIMHANEVGAPDVLNYNWDNDEGFWLPMRLPGTFPTIMDELPEGVFNLYYTATRFWRILHLRALCRAALLHTINGAK